VLLKDKLRPKTANFRKIFGEKIAVFGRKKLFPREKTLFRSRKFAALTPQDYMP